MGRLFAGQSRFQANISAWDTSSATTMQQMFSEAHSFTADITYWDTSRVGSADAYAMFYNATGWLEAYARDSPSAANDGPPGAWMAVACNPKPCPGDGTGCGEAVRCIGPNGACAVRPGPVCVDGSGSSSAGVAAGATVALLLGVVAAVLLVRHRRRPAQRGTDVGKLLLARAAATLAQHYSKVQSEATGAQARVIEASALHFGRTIGQGVHGRVLEATMQLQRLAVKLPAAGLGGEALAAQGAALLNEALLLAVADGHPAIVPMTGVLLGPGPERVGFCTPLMENGNLKQYLQRCRPGVEGAPVLTLGAVATMMRALASAMVWLEQRAIIHRDLAARNVLVGAGGEVRLADLGAGRVLLDVVYTASTEHTPVRWMAPESLAAGVFSHKSDAWAFGVLLWEMTSLGQTPYRALSNGEVAAALDRGERLEEQPLAPPRVHPLMARCWNASPRQRPSFRAVWDELVAIERAVLALKGVRDAHMGPGGVLVYPSGSPEGYLTVAAEVAAGGGEGSGSVAAAVDDEGYVAEGAERAGQSAERCSRCRARIKWCTCQLSSETRL